jgi:hypothetical protein
MEKREERWKYAREVIAHEDNLTAQRVTWFLTLQGFLFTALTFGTNGLASGVNKEYHWLLHTILLLVSAAGIASPFLVVPMLTAAIRQRRAVGFWWREYGQKSDTEWAALDDKFKFPPAKGPESNEFDYAERHGMTEKNIGGWPLLGAFYLPHALAGVWVLVFGLLIASLVVMARTTPESGTNVTIKHSSPVNAIKVDYDPKK